MLYGLCENGLNCVYDLPQKLTVEEFNNLITGYNDKEWQCEELQGQPILKGIRQGCFFIPLNFEMYRKFDTFNFL